MILNRIGWFIPSGLLSDTDPLGAKHRCFAQESNTAFTHEEDATLAPAIHIH